MANALANVMVQNLCVSLPVQSLEKTLDPLQAFLSKPGTEMAFPAEPGRRKVFARFGFFPFFFFFLQGFQQTGSKNAVLEMAFEL